MLSSFRQACRIGFVGSGMDAMCLRGQLPQKGPSFVHTLHGFSVPVSSLLSPTMTFPCRSPGFDCCCNFAWGLTLFQWSEAGLLGQPSLGICAGAHSVALGLQGMSGIWCLIALILPMFAASSGRYLMMLMGRCSCSFGIPIRRPFVIVSLPFLAWQMTRTRTCPHKPMLAEWTI